MIEINWNPTRKDLRIFAVLEVIFFGVIATLIYRRTGSVGVGCSVFAAAVLVGTIGWFVPAFMRRVYIGWMMAVFPIGWIVSHLVMAGIFFLVIWPIGLMMRLCGRDPMQRRFDRTAASYWIRRKPDTGKQRYFRQF